LVEGLFVIVLVFAKVYGIFVVVFVVVVVGEASGASGSKARFEASSDGSVEDGVGLPKVSEGSAASPVANAAQLLAFACCRRAACGSGTGFDLAIEPLDGLTTARAACNWSILHVPRDEIVEVHCDGSVAPDGTTHQAV
jgi:hypothetical protein